MNKYCITFGQEHIHKINGTILDKDCVAVIKAETEKEARKIAFDLFKGNFFTSYKYEEFGDKIKYFNRGFIEIN